MFRLFPPPEVTVAFLARASERLALPPATGADIEALAARPAEIPIGRRAGAEGWIAAGSWAGKPAVFAENALGEVFAIRVPPSRSMTPISSVTLLRRAISPSEPVAVEGTSTALS